MKICVTGGAGFIGSHLVDKLIEQDNEVIVIDNLSTGLEQNINPKAKFVKVDLSIRNYKFESVFNELENCDQVYHLAATVGYKKVLENPLKCFNNNIDSLKAVIETCEIKKTKVLFASSSEVYGTNSRVLYEEALFGSFTNPQNGKDCYAISKWVGEFLLHWNTNIDSVIVRLFNTSGARQRPDFGMVLPSFVKAGLDNTKATIMGHGQQRRSFCHVNEVVDALITIMNTPTIRAELFNIGNPNNNISIAGLCELSGCNNPIYRTYDEVLGHPNFIDAGDRKPDISKVIKRMYWKPRIGIDKIIEDNKKWQISLCRL